MGYTFEEKIAVTRELLEDIAAKSWQEIESLQGQISNLAKDASGDALSKLLKNLLTSYYIFVGGLENLSTDTTEAQNYTSVQNDDMLLAQNQKVELNDIAPITIDDIVHECPTTNTDDFEPFEYFVDFDEPSGKPLSDEDLYGN